jgi:hypothetical protein
MKKDAIMIDRASVSVMVNKKTGNDQRLNAVGYAAMDERDKLLFGLRTNIASGAYAVKPEVLAMRLIEASLQCVLRRKPVDFRC